MNILFIGDEKNSNYPYRPILEAPSMIYLKENIIDRFRIKRYYIINSKDYRDSRHLISDPRFMVSDIIICLGRKAEKRIKRLIGNKYYIYYLPHPSYWRRFHYNNPLYYGWLFKKEMRKSANI